MSVTRTTIYAHVVFDIIRKNESGKVESDTMETTLANCDTRMKADIMLAKEYPKAIVTVNSINFTAEKRKMSDDVFYANSEFVSTEELSEDELIAKAERRKKNK